METVEPNNDINALKKDLLQKKKELNEILQNSMNDLSRASVEIGDIINKLRNEYLDRKAELSIIITQAKERMVELNTLINQTESLLPKPQNYSPTPKKIIDVPRKRTPAPPKEKTEFSKTVEYYPTNELTIIMETENYTIGSFNLNTKTRILSSNNSSVRLTRKESQLLALMAANVNQLLNRSYCLLTIWDDESYLNGRSMDVYLCKLRKLLQDDNSINIVNIHGKGYKLIVSKRN